MKGNKIYSEAEKESNRTAAKRLDLLYEAAAVECDVECGGRWLTCARELLEKNDIHPAAFAQAVKDLLQRGRSKHRNITVYGVSNCGKTFILKPLTKIYRCFQNPSKDRFAWVGVDEAEVILLNDFRWSSEVISWGDMLRLTEGDTVKLPAPKTMFSKDVELTDEMKTPIFATSIGPIMYGRSFDEDSTKEQAMMDNRWRLFHFKHVIAEDDEVELPRCTKCFASLIKTCEDF